MDNSTRRDGLQKDECQGGAERAPTEPPPRADGTPPGAIELAPFEGSIADECARLVPVLFLYLFAVAVQATEAEGRSFLRTTMLLARVAWAELGKGSVELLRALASRLEAIAPRSGVGSASWPYVANGLEAITWLMLGAMSEAIFVFADLRELQSGFAEGSPELERLRGLGVELTIPKAEAGGITIGPVECKQRIDAALCAAGLRSPMDKAGPLASMLVGLHLQNNKGARALAYDEFVGCAEQVRREFFGDMPGKLVLAMPSNAVFDAFEKRKAEERAALAKRAAEAN